MKKRINEVIEASGLKKRYIAKKLGINENTLRNWGDESKNSWPRLDQAAELADLLNCDIKDLYERTD